jgi:hypothetical protein
MWVRAYAFAWQALGKMWVGSAYWERVGVRVYEHCTPKGGHDGRIEVAGRI